MAWFTAFTDFIWAIVALLGVIALHRLVKPISAALMGVAQHMTTKKASDAIKLIDDAHKLLTDDDRGH